MFDRIKQVGALLDAAQAWFLAQSSSVQILFCLGAIAVLWVLWILVRVLFLALRVAFRGL